MVKEVLESKEEIISKILEKSELKQEDLEKKIKDKQEEYGGLLTEAGAAYAIAKDEKIDLELKEEEPHPIKINELKEGLEGVDLLGRVVRVFQPRDWKSSKGEGRVGSFVLNDGTGEIRLTIWNQDCEVIDSGKLQKGSIVEARNASIRKRNELLEASLGFSGQLIFKENADVPDFKEKIVLLSELKEGMNDVNCFARVVRAFPIKEFQRENGLGKVSSLIITDGTETRIALWDANAEIINKLNENDVIKIEGAYSKKNQDRIELNLGWRGRILINPENAPVLPEVASKNDRVKVTDLNSGDSFKEIRATIVRVFPPNTFEFDPKTGKKPVGDEPTKTGLILNAELDDGYGVIRSTFFRDQAEKFLGFTAEQFVKDPDVFKEKVLLGEEMVFRGQARHNEVSDRMEFIVRDFSEENVEKELEAFI